MKKYGPFYIKQGDTLPPLNVVLLDSQGNTIPEADISTAQFSMRQGSNVKVSSQTATYVGPAEFNYYWSILNGDTDTPGRYEGEISVLMADGTTRTFPNDGYIEIIITEAVA